MNSRPPQPQPQPQQHPNNIPQASMPVSVTATSLPLPSAPQMPYNRQNSNLSNSANDDGWVLVPSQTESDA